MVWSHYSQSEHKNIYKDVILYDYKCRIFPVDSFKITKPANKWQYGPRVCLSNFNPGDTNIPISDMETAT